MPTVKDLEKSVADEVVKSLGRKNAGAYRKLFELQSEIDSARKRLKAVAGRDTTALDEESHDIAFQYGRRHGEHVFRDLAAVSDLTFALHGLNKRSSAVREAIEQHLELWRAADFESPAAQIEDDPSVRSFLPKFMPKDQLEKAWVSGFEHRRVQRSDLRDSLITRVEGVLNANWRTSALLSEMERSLREPTFIKPQVGKWIYPAQESSFGQLKGVDGVYEAGALARGAFFLSERSEPIMARNLSGPLGLLEKTYRAREAALVAISDSPRFADALIAAERGLIDADGTGRIVEAVLIYQADQGIDDEQRSFGINLEDFVALPVLAGVFIELQRSGSLLGRSLPHKGLDR